MRIFIAMLAALSIGHSAMALDITADDITYFLEESYAQYGEMESPPEMEEQLYVLAKEHKTPVRLLKEFARHYAISVAKADRLASLIIESVRIREGKDPNWDYRSCKAFNNHPVSRGLKSLANDPLAAEIFISVGKNISRHGIRPCFISLAGDIREPFPVFRSLYHYSSDFIYVIPLLMDDALPPEQARTLFERKSNDVRHADKLTALRLATDGHSQKKTKDPSLYFLQAALIKELLHTGLTEEALKAYGKIRPENRDAFWAPVTEEPSEEEDYILRDAFFDLAIDLAGALVRDNDLAETKRLLAFYHDDFSKEPDSYHRENRLQRSQRAAFVAELIERNLKPSEVYDIFIDGYPEGTAPPAGFKDPKTGRSMKAGWLWAIQKASPAVKKQATEYLAQAGYPGMAAYFSDGRLFYENDQALELDTVVDAKSFSKLKRQYQQKLDKAKQAHVASKPEDRKSENLAIYSGPRPLLFKELPLPEQYRTQRKKDQEASEIPEGMELPVHPYSIVRMEQSGDRWYILFQTQQIDPAGEVSGGGYWLVRSASGGKSWEEPLYLGLQAYFPYEILGSSKLPLIDGELVNIAVNIRELDEESITFPPIGLQAKRRKEGLYIQFRWEDLTRDQDEDGLTDLFEHRVGMNPIDPDSDGDGIPDKEDSLPLTPFKHHDNDSKQLAMALLEPIWGHEGAAHILGIPANSAETDLSNFVTAMGTDGHRFASDDTLILTADPKLFEGLHLTSRVLVYDSASLEKLDNTYGVFYAAGIQHMFKSLDGKKFYVIWSASWTGGSYRIIKENGTFKMVEESSWIT